MTRDERGSANTSCDGILFHTPKEEAVFGDQEVCKYWTFHHTSIKQKCLNDCLNNHHYEYHLYHSLFLV